MSERGKWGTRLRRPSGVVFALLLSVVLLVSPVRAAETPFASPSKTLLQKKVVVLLMDGLQLGDISPTNTPNLWKLQQLGAVGVMNQNTLGPRDDVNSYLTIGAGSRASAPFRTVEAYGVQDRVKEEGHVVTGRDLYLRDMGTLPTGAVVVPQLPQIEEQAGKTRSPFTPGMLGEAVQQLGGRTAVLGNADLGQQVHRPATLLAMNRQGQVDFGNLHAGVKVDRTRPYGMRTDMSALFASYRVVRDKANLIVLETGDLLRLQRASDLMESSQVANDRLQALQEGDQLVGMLLPEISTNTMLAVVSPTKQSTTDAPPVAPILLAGGDIQAGGLLTSNTTKREGLLTNFDLAPTFVRFLGGDAVNAFSFVGQPAQGIPSKKATVQGTDMNSFQKLSNIVESMWVPSRARNVLVKPWLNTWVGMAAVILLASLFRRRVLRYLQPLAEAMLILPLAWLFVPLYHPHGTGEEALLSFGIALAIWVLLSNFRDRISRLGALAAITAVTLIVDVLLGAPLEKQSVLSYDPIAGARYYGIGNEYMGVLLGSVLHWLNAMHRKHAELPRSARLTSMGVFFLVVYILAAPTLGTNFGGALAAAIGFTYAMLVVANLRLHIRHWLLLGLVSAMVVGGMILLNVLLPSTEQTHIGRAMHQLANGQFLTVWQLATRKLALNAHLLRVSAWGELFLLFGALLLVAWGRQKWGDAPPDTFFTRHGKMVVVSALAVLLFNDSGVVAGALTLLYAIVPLVNADDMGSTQPSLPCEETQPSQ